MTFRTMSLLGVDCLRSTTSQAVGLVRSRRDVRRIHTIAYIAIVIGFMAIWNLSNEMFVGPAVSTDGSPCSVGTASDPENSIAIIVGLPSPQPAPICLFCNVAHEPILDRYSPSDWNSKRLTIAMPDIVRIAKAEFDSRSFCTSDNGTTRRSAHREHYSRNWNLGNCNVAIS